MLALHEGFYEGEPACARPIANVARCCARDEFAWCHTLACNLKHAEPTPREELACVGASAQLSALLVQQDRVFACNPGAGTGRKKKQSSPMKMSTQNASDVETCSHPNPSHSLHARFQARHLMYHAADICACSLSCIHPPESTLSPSRMTTPQGPASKPHSII